MDTPSQFRRLHFLSDRFCSLLPPLLSTSVTHPSGTVKLRLVYLRLHFVRFFQAQEVEGSACLSRVWQLPLPWQRTTHNVNKNHPTSAFPPESSPAEHQHQHQHLRQRNLSIHRPLPSPFRCSTGCPPCCPNIYLVWPRHTRLNTSPISHGALSPDQLPPAHQTPRNKCTRLPRLHTTPDLAALRPSNSSITPVDSHSQRHPLTLTWVPKHPRGQRPFLLLPTLPNGVFIR